MKKDEKIIYDVASLKTDIKYIRESMKSYGIKIDKLESSVSVISEKVDNISASLENHIREHVEVRREMFVKFGLFISALNIVLTILFKIFVG